MERSMGRLLREQDEVLLASYVDEQAEQRVMGGQMMELVDTGFASYLEDLIPPRSPILQEMEAYARANRFPIVGPVAGQLLYMLTRLTGARRVFALRAGY